MLNRPLHRAVGLVLTGIVVAGPSAGCTSPLSSLGGCSDRDERFAATLDDLSIMAAHPDAATQISSSSGCDTDDGFANASRQYQTGMVREDIMSFYRKAATSDGWQADGEDATPVPSTGLVVSGAAGCFRKEVDGTTAYLKVWFPSDFYALDDPYLQEQAGVYGIDVTGSHDGNAWC